MRPSLMPYGLPSVQTADEKHSPSAVGSTRLLTASATATAVDAAGERSNLLAISPPTGQVFLRSLYLCPGSVLQLAMRKAAAVPGSEFIYFWQPAAQFQLHDSCDGSPLPATVGLNSYLNQCSSCTTSIAGSPPMHAFKKSGTCAQGSLHQLIALRSAWWGGWPSPQLCNMNKQYALGKCPRCPVDVRSIWAASVCWLVDGVHLSGTVITPDTQVGDGSVKALRFVCQLAPSPVFIKPHQRMEIGTLQPRSVLHADEGIGVARIPHNEYLTFPACHLIQCPPLRDK